jgi:hypothetical protein
MTHKALSERTTGQQAYGTKGDSTMRKKDPEKIIKDLEDYRLDGDRQRLLDEIDSYMDVESVDDNHATVKHAWLGFVPDDQGIDRLTCDLATWEMQWDKQAGSWVVDGSEPEETYFEVDFTKELIPWKKIRGLICRTDEECAQVIASSSRFENAFIAATASLDEDEDDIYSVVADPLLRKALRPPEE